MPSASQSVFVALGFFALSAVASAAPDHRWTLSYLAAPGTTYYDIAQAIPDRIRKATNGRVEINANSSLVPGNRLLEAVRDGDVQMSMPLTGYYTASQPLFTLAVLPGMSESLEDMQRVLASPYGAALRDLYAREYKSKELMTAAYCPQTMFSNKPVNTIEDWNGLRVRVNNAATATLANVLGAKPIALTLTEVLPALQRGVVDAVVTDACWAYGAGFYTAVKYASAWKLGSVAPITVLVNQEAWGKLPKDLQQAVESELAKLEKEFKVDYAARIAALPKQWEGKNVKYHVVNETETRRIYGPRYMGPVYETWYKQADAKGIESRKWEKVVRDALGR